MSQVLKPRVIQWHGSTWECSSCGDKVLNDVASKGMKREKCDACIKEKKRLVDMVKYWERKVLKK